MSIAIPVLYWNLEGGYTLTDKKWNERVDDQVQLILDSGCWLFLAVEVHEEKSSTFGSAGSGHKYLLSKFKAKDTDWALVEGDGGNHGYYRPSKLTSTAAKSKGYATKSRSYSDFTFRENTTGFVWDAWLTHLRADDDAKDGKSKSRSNERKLQGREFARAVARSGYAIAAGDFNSSTEREGYPRDSMEDVGFRGLRQRGPVTNGTTSSRNTPDTVKKKKTFWIDEIWTRPAQAISGAALVPANSASDHNALKVTVTWDAAAPPTTPPAYGTLTTPTPYSGRPWMATVRDRDFAALDTVRFLTGTLVETYNQPDMLSLTGTWAGLDAALEPGQGLLLHDDLGRLRFSGHLVDLDVQGTKRATLIYASDTVRLWWARCWPKPANEWSKAGQNTAYDIQTGPAETRLLSYVNRNLGPAARDERVEALLRLPADHARGGVATSSIRFDKLGDVASALAEQANLRMRVIQTYDGWTPHLDLALDDTLDLTDSVSFATPQDGGTFQLSNDWRNRIALPTVNVALGAGGGTGADRVLTLLEDQDSQDLWNARIEDLVDLGDSVDATEMATSMTAAIAAGAGPTEISLPIGRAPGLGVEIPTGTVVTAVANGEIYTDRIRQVTTVLAKQTTDPTVKTTGTIGSPDGGVKTPTQQRLAQALADAKRGQRR